MKLKDKLKILLQVTISLLTAAIAIASVGNPDLVAKLQEILEVIQRLLQVF